jgi:DNA/RNA-binding domain of Phe-tRNA-synthetase-like protein
MKFKIDYRIFEKFQGLNIGIVIARNVNNKGVSEEILKKIKEQERKIRSKYNIETLSQQPKIDIWRRAYSTFGAKPKENKSSVENLYRLILNGVELRHINKLVDIYNFISIKHMLPVGGEDIDRMKGYIELTFAGQNEVPILLLGDKDPRPPHEGEVIYKDDISTKLTEETKNCILVIEGLQPIIKEEVKDATKELTELIREFCGGNISCDVLNKDKTEIEIK